MGCICADEDEQDSPPPKQISPMKKNVCCTDIIMLTIFVAYVVGMVVVGIYAFMFGDGWRLFYGFDSFGNRCDNENNPLYPNISESMPNNGRNTSGLSNVFFMNILEPAKAMEVCVSTCPREYLRTKEAVRDFALNNGSRLCAYDIDPADYTDQTFSRMGPCPELPVLPSISLLNRCVPDITKLDAVDSAGEVLDQTWLYINTEELARQVVADLYNSWREMLALCGIALLLAVMVVLCIRYLASIIVWVIIGLTIVTSLLGTAFLWWTWYQIKTGHDAVDDIQILSVDVTNENAFLAYSIIASVLTVILLLIILVMRSRIALVITLFHEAGKCLASIPLLLIQPIWTFLILIFFLVIWLFIFAFIVTYAYPELTSDNGFEEIVYVSPDYVNYVMAFYAVGLIWVSEFILACQQMVISGSVGLWYFTREKSSLSCTVGKATSRLILHHLGTAAFGAFIITLVKVPRLILMYIQKKCKGSENMLAQCCLKCCICCLYCLEKCLKFLNQNAYTITVIEGKNFCSAACKAFKIITSNVLRVAAINSVGDFMLFLGKIIVTAGTLAIAVLWLRELRYDHETKEGLHMFALPVLLVTIFAFFIAHCFLSIYEMVVDTLLLCFCEDCQMNDGTEGREYYMSPSLMEYVKDASNQLETETKKDGDMLAGEAPPPTAV